MAIVTTDDGVKIDYEFDDFTNPWDDEAEVIGLLHGSTLNKNSMRQWCPIWGENFAYCAGISVVVGPPPLLHRVQPYQALRWMMV